MSIYMDFLMILLNLGLILIGVLSGFYHLVEFDRGQKPYGLAVGGLALRDLAVGG